ncbi:MAG TPA: MerR family transcriptional regulator [Candidatus Tumulicola sp.]
MATLLTIGDFARATHLSVRTLRKYHESGLLEPASVDPGSGYRHYAVEQIANAQIIRRFRSLDMPLADIRSVLSAPDLQTRNDLISAHLQRLESTLTKTQSAVASLRNLLAPPATSPNIEHRSVNATTAISITDVLDAGNSFAWYQGALGELYAKLKAAHLTAAGSAGGIFSNEVFLEARGEATIFVPFNGEIHPRGRVEQRTIPKVELAIITYAGSHDDVDIAYGALGAYVTEHTLAVDAPIREYYVVGPQHTSDEVAWLTEIAWPIFQTRAHD